MDDFRALVRARAKLSDSVRREYEFYCSIHGVNPEPDDTEVLVQLSLREAEALLAAVGLAMPALLSAKSHGSPLSTSGDDGDGDQKVARIHELKCWPDFFRPIVSGEKSFELRYDDRGFRAGDILRLREWLPRQKRYTGREAWRLVTYVLAGRPWLEKGYIALGLRPISPVFVEQENKE